MNERSELERLQQRQVRLEQELSLLATQLKQLEARLNAAPPATAPVAVPPQIEPSQATAPVQPKRAVPPPIPVPPIIQPVWPSVPVQAKAAEPVSKPADPKPEATQSDEFVPDFVRTETPRNEPGSAFAAKEQSSKKTTSFTPPPALQSPPAPEPRSSFEMRVGTYWLVRIGIVMLLTGLVFFGNYAYQNFIVRFGAVGKVLLLYLASGALLGAGTWWQRKAVKESLRNYAQVLFAGGLAAVYFTTYAAHHFENLRVIKNPLLDGVLLLAWAGFIAWIADRKKSEVLALFAVGLAYYTSVITRVGSFTLYSNLVLTVAVLFFLVRNRWAGLSWASLIATYTAYAYWRFFHGGEGWSGPGLGFAASFLWSYWLVFTVAVFLSKHENIAGEKRAAFLTFNNGAMFTLFTLAIYQADPDRFWQFSLGYGIVLLALAELSRRFLTAEPVTKNTYLTQGLVLVTVGLVSKYLDTPRTLALVLAAESVMLFILGTFRKNIFLQTGAYLSGAMAMGWGIDGVERNNTRGLWLGTTLGAFMVLNAFWSHWRMAWADRRGMRPVPAYFTTLALLIWFFTTWQNTTHANFGLVLAIVAIALTLSIYVLRVPEIPLLGMSYLLLAQAAWAFGVPNHTAIQLAFALAGNAAVLLYVAFQRQSLVALRAGACLASALAVLWGIAGLERNDSSGLFAGVALGAVMAAKALWMHRRSAESDARLLRPAPGYFTVLALVMWVATTWFNTTTANFPLALAVEAAVLTAAVYAFRVREFAMLGQGLLVLAHFAWLVKFMEGTPTPSWWNPLLMIVVTLGLSYWWQRQKVVGGDASLGVAFQTAYALALVALVYVWLEPQNPAPEWLALTSLLAVAMTAYGVFTRNWPLAICGQIFLAVSAGQFVSQLSRAKPEGHFALVPIAALGVLSFATWLWFALKPESKPQLRDPLLQLAMVYRWVALLMSIWWVSEYIPDREQIWVFLLMGLAVFLFAGWRQSREGTIFGAAFTACGLVSLWLPSQRDLLVYAPNLALLAFLAQQQIARRRPERFSFDEIIHSVAMLIGCLCVWRFVSCWVLDSADKDYLTATWSALALVMFGCGIGLRERMYRWTGLAVLATALGRVVVFDVWKLETIYRVLSFMALGIVLLVLGFFYNKYQEKIRQWL